MENKIFLILPRISIAIVYIWFGIIKIFLLSPADELVSALFNKTLSFTSIAPSTFLIILGIAETIIGIMWLLPKYTKCIFWITSCHLITTILPLFFLTSITWQAFLIPTLVGQYIIKNIIIFALIYGVYIKFIESGNTSI